jgi:hypothetical protein
MENHSGGTKDLEATSLTHPFISKRWIWIADQRVLRIPPDYQESIGPVHDSMVALSLRNGTTTIIEFDGTKLVGCSSHKRWTETWKWVEAAGQEGTDLFEMWLPSPRRSVRDIMLTTLSYLVKPGGAILMLLLCVVTAYMPSYLSRVGGIEQRQTGLLGQK